ncbi:protein lethal(2)essential for life [Orussus abietinus]|uniref:protein lethal(2)essential for life n=1 Tax=Orussus abietinus TaxID=222816 RepID=UPI000626205F|nr:protein lethal(2)essential for life [Orussus abietinus]
MRRMALIPKLFSHWWEHLDRPHRLMDQHFGHGLHPDQLFNPSFYDRRFPFVYYRPWGELFRDDESSGWSVVKADKDKFQVALDVQQFKPEEVNVKVVDKYVVVEGKHEEKEDEHGMISRHFMRKYMIPEQCDVEKVSSTLSSDGVLTITAPRKPESIEQKQERTIKIEHVEKPAIEKAASKSN